ncbi:MAG: putative virulence protein [Prokaryotic dsDNA virus sp.]|nr:MAG: putative virulence protein [Prokaryotic dsDNA virus sp.]
MITIFKNIKETETPYHREINFILDRIRNGSSKERVKLIRQEKDKTLRNKIKQDLPAICFSGKFNKRSDTSLLEHSGFICLDFDGYKTKKDLMSAKESLSKNKYVYSVFVSPSGNGLKTLVKIPQDSDNHIGYFRALEEYFKSEYFDKACKNISRVCYESYDPLIYVNENSSLWDKIEEHEYRPIDKFKERPTIPITDENKVIERLMAWWKKKYGFIEGERNNNLYVLAAAFNDFGINKSLAEYIMSDFQSKDFSLSEIKTTIDSAYRHAHKFGTKYYEDEEKVFQIRQKIKKGVPKKEIRSQLIDSNIEDDVATLVINQIEEDESSRRFWTKSDKGVIKIVHYLFREFLEESGFFKFCPEGGKSFVFVKVTNNLIDHTNETEIKDHVLDYLENKVEDLEVYNFFADKTRFFREDFLSLLNPVNAFFISDDKYTSYLYYRNCAVKVTNKGVTQIDYIDLDGFVWKDHVIDRDYIDCEIDECDFQKFIGNVCGQDKVRIKSMESTMGYLLHGFKNLSYSPAVILNDEVISDNPEGGTGKGIFMNAISQMKKVVVIDGKGFTFEKSFAYQLVSADTQVLVFDDVKKHFDFERLFSVVTEGLTLEKKNKDAIKIPFSKSPKIAITTNYAIRGKGSSFERRKWELEFKQHYNSIHTPFQEFGKLLFGDWNDDEWCLFDNYMVTNLQNFLKTGLVKSEFVNLKIRKLSAETCHDFIEWCGLIDGSEKNEKLVINKVILKKELYSEFILENPDYAPRGKMSISMNKFYKWLNSYGQFMTGLAPIEGRSSEGRWIKFIDEKEKEKNNQTDAFDIPF